MSEFAGAFMGDFGGNMSPKYRKRMLKLWRSLPKEAQTFKGFPVFMKGYKDTVGAEETRVHRKKATTNSKNPWIIFFKAHSGEKNEGEKQTAFMKRMGQLYREENGIKKKTKSKTKKTKKAKKAMKGGEFVATPEEMNNMRNYFKKEIVNMMAKKGGKKKVKKHAKKGGAYADYI